MARKKKEEKVAEEVIEQGGDMKMKKTPKPKRPKQLVSKEEPDVIKVDLDKPKEKVEEDTIKDD